jgi:molecular chaperone GrpE
MSDEQLPTAMPEASAPDSAATIAELENKLRDAEARVLRAHAELENFRRRTRREQDEQLKYAALPLISGLIEVVDNLARALAAAEAQSGQGLTDGVRLVQTQLEQLLRQQGCQRIVSVDAPFDPNVHSALQMRPSDHVPANTVIEETRSGFQLHDRVVRPAQVIVSTGKTPAANVR